MDKAQVVADLKRDEGWRAYAYHDHLGFLTIGHGFLIDERRGGRLPKAVGHLWLQYEVDKRWDALRKARPWVETQPEPVQRALVNMVYQLGLTGVLGFKRMLGALEAGDRETAAAEALDSKWAEQTPERAARVASWIRSDEGG